MKGETVDAKEEAWVEYIKERRVVALLERDPHYFGDRPCWTCDAVSCETQEGLTVEEFMCAIAQTLRNLGLDATYDARSVIVANCVFEAKQRYYRKSFQFCGRTYRSGNVLQAAVDLLQELPQRIAQREEAVRRASLLNAARELDKKLREGGTGLRVSVVGGDKFMLSYVSDDLDGVTAVATKVDEQLRALSDAWWQSLMSAEVAAIAHFTAEGGFSLN